MREMDIDSPPLAELEDEDGGGDEAERGSRAESAIIVKAEPEDLDPSQSELDRAISPPEREDEEEVNIKDWKPDVSLSYKGKPSSI